MDLRNWEFSTNGSAIAGANVYVREAITTHPNTGTVLGSATTDSNGLWTVTGLTETPKDVEVVYNNRSKWYKGLVWVDVGRIRSGEADNAPLTINGNLDHFQRAVGNSVTSTTTYNILTSYAADRIFVLPAGASVAQQRSTTVPDTKSQYSLAVTGAASVTTVDIGQRIEQAVVKTRGLQSLVFSCWVRNESGAAFTPTLRINTPTVADNFATTNNRLAQALQSCADSAWTRVWWVFDPSGYTDITNGMEAVLQIPSGSLVAGKTVRIAQFDLRPGDAIRTYQPPPVLDELTRCRRYYRKSFPQATAPAQATGIIAGAVSAVVQVAGVGGACGVCVPFDPPMRGAPTVTTFNTNVANSKFYNIATAASAGAETILITGDTGITLYSAQTAGEVASQALVVHYTANAEL